MSPHDASGAGVSPVLPDLSSVAVIQRHTTSWAMSDEQQALSMPALPSGLCPLGASAAP